MFGLENKYKDEVARLHNNNDELILILKAQINALTTSLNAKVVECEEQKSEILSLKEDNAKLKDYIIALEACNSDSDMAEQLQIALDDNAKLKKQVQYLKLFAPKQSEKQKIDKDDADVKESALIENTGNESSVSEKSETESKSKKKSKAKEEIKTRKKGKHNGNNGARYNKHEYDDIATDTIELNPELPEDIDISNLEFMGTKTIVKFTAETKMVVKRLEYQVNMYKDPETGKIYNGKVPETPLRGGYFTSAFIALLICLKYAAHISVSTIRKMFSSSNFDIAESTLNGLINKTASSQFFRNLDMVLQFAILQSAYIMMDETFAKARTETARVTKQFIIQFYIWVQLSIDIGLVRFSSSGGSRKYEIGYNLVKYYKGLAQTDGYGCYINMQDDVAFPNIVRLACIQHVKRRYLLLAEKDPRAKEILDLYNEFYIMDDERERIAKLDLLAGKEWTMEDHVNWRYEHALVIIKKIEAKLLFYSKDPTILPKSSLAIAINHSLNEMKAVKAIFEQKHVICRLDSNAIENINRSISKFRRISEAFGSVSAGENQCIFFSLVESCRMHNVNVQDYFKFLLDKMSKMSNYVIENMDSPHFNEFRNLLPDVYAKKHQAKPKFKWTPKIDITKPIHKDAKRKAYKKHKHKTD